MIDLEERIRRGLNAAAATQATPPGFEGSVTRRISVVRRRRAITRGLATAAVVVTVLGSIAALRPDSSTPTRVIAGGQTHEPGWNPIAGAPIPPRFGALAVGMGDRTLIWGGGGGNDGGADRLDGAVYDAVHDSWTKVPDSPLVSSDAVGAWTGREAIVVSGIHSSQPDPSGAGGHGPSPVVAAAYDPAANSWRRLPSPPLANASSVLNRAIWTGRELVIAGTATQVESVPVVNQVAIYNPDADRWRTGSVPAEPLPFGAGAVWTGTEVAVVGNVISPGEETSPNFELTGMGHNTLQLYNPATDRWREIPWGLDYPRVNLSTAWTGDRLFVGGGDQPTLRRDAALVDLETGTWDRVPDAPIGFAGNAGSAQLWTGTSALTLAGDGGRPVGFDPATRRWTVGPPDPIAARGAGNGAWVWIESQRAVVVWGGADQTQSSRITAIEGGETYTPDASPTPTVTTGPPLPPQAKVPPSTAAAGVP